MWYRTNFCGCIKAKKALGFTYQITQFTATHAHKRETKLISLIDFQFIVNTEKENLSVNRVSILYCISYWFNTFGEIIDFRRKCQINCTRHNIFIHSSHWQINASSGCMMHSMSLKICQQWWSQIVQIYRVLAFANSHLFHLFFRAYSKRFSLHQLNYFYSTRN